MFQINNKTLNKRYMLNLHNGAMAKTSTHLQQDKSVNTVQKTNDYTKFKTKQGNRELNKLHLKRLMSSVKELDLLHANPILVNERFEIIDGQHRFEVCQELKKPVYFIVVKGLGLNEIQVLNANSKNWKIEDYIDGYCSMGKSDYLELKKYIKSTNLGVTVLVALFCGSDNGDYITTLKNGDLKITHKHRGLVILKWINEWETHYAGFSRRSFVLALAHLYTVKGYNHDKMMQKIKYQSAKLVDSINTKTYLALLEEIYNYKERGEKLRFF